MRSESAVTGKTIGHVFKVTDYWLHKTQNNTTVMRDI